MLHRSGSKRNKPQPCPGSGDADEKPRWYSPLEGEFCPAILLVTSVYVQLYFYRALDTLFGMAIDTPLQVQGLG